MASTQLTAVSGSTLEQLIDSIERQRKDIEFLLAHLDDDNILNLKGLKVSVGNSNLEVWADGIDMSVGDLNSDYSSLSLRVDGIDATVQDVSGDYSSLSLRVDGITSTVSGHSSEISSMQSSITQNADNIALKVSTTDFNGNTIASKINLSSTTATIDAQKINLLGITNVASEFQLGNAGDTNQKSIKFRGTSTWIYDDLSKFSITSDKQIEFWSSSGYTFNSLGSLTANNMTVNLRGSTTDFTNSIIDFSGAYITGGYAKFG